MDDVNWRVAPVYIVWSSSSFVRACFKGEREGQYLFSILYRISLFPFLFAVVSIFTILFSQNCVGIVFLFSRALRYHIRGHFPSPRLWIRSLLRQRNLSPRFPICISYRIVLYSNCQSAVSVFGESGNGQLARHNA